jgi:hypothetical protein
MGGRPAAASMFAEAYDEELADERVNQECGQILRPGKTCLKAAPVVSFPSTNMDSEYPKVRPV